MNVNHFDFLIYNAMYVLNLKKKGGEIRTSDVADMLKAPLESVEKELRMLVKNPYGERGCTSWISRGVHGWLFHAD